MASAANKAVQLHTMPHSHLLSASLCVLSVHLTVQAVGFSQD